MVKRVWVWVWVRLRLLASVARARRVGGLLGRIAGGEHRRLGVGACTHALRQLTRGSCLSAALQARSEFCRATPS